MEEEKDRKLTAALSTNPSALLSNPQRETKKSVKSIVILNGLLNPRSSMMGSRGRIVFDGRCLKSSGNGNSRFGIGFGKLDWRLVVEVRSDGLAVV
jgi:hypothetical protein